MSAPVVAGVAALVLQAHPDWTPDQVKWALINSSRLLKSRLGEVNAAAVLAPGTWRIPSANRGIEKNEPARPGHGRHRLHAVELDALELDERRRRPDGELVALELDV